MTVQRQMVTPTEDSPANKSPSLGNTSQDQRGDCQSKTFCQAVGSQYAGRLEVSNSNQAIPQTLRKGEQSGGSVSVTGRGLQRRRLEAEQPFEPLLSRAGKLLRLHVLRPQEDAPGRSSPAIPTASLQDRRLFPSGSRSLKHGLCTPDFSQGLRSPSLFSAVL